MVWGWGTPSPNYTWWNNLGVIFGQLPLTQDYSYGASSCINCHDLGFLHNSIHDVTVIYVVSHIYGKIHCFCIVYNLCYVSNFCVLYIWLIASLTEIFKCCIYIYIASSISLTAILQECICYVLCMMYYYFVQFTIGTSELPSAEP